MESSRRFNASQESRPVASAQAERRRRAALNSFRSIPGNRAAAAVTGFEGALNGVNKSGTAKDARLPSLR